MVGPSSCFDLEGAEGCGHWIPEERPQWVIGQLLAFFGEEDERG